MERKAAMPEHQAEIDRIRAEARALFADHMRDAVKHAGAYIDRLAEAAVLGGRPTQRKMHRAFAEIAREAVGDAEYQARHGRRAV